MARATQVPGVEPDHEAVVAHHPVRARREVGTEGDWVSSIDRAADVRSTPA